MASFNTAAHGAWHRQGIFTFNFPRSSFISGEAGLGIVTNAGTDIAAGDDHGSCFSGQTSPDHQLFTPFSDRSLQSEMFLLHA
jgi:hypothetical protein